MPNTPEATVRDIVDAFTKDKGKSQLRDTPAQLLFEMVATRFLDEEMSAYQAAQYAVVAGYLLCREDIEHETLTG